MFRFLIRCVLFFVGVVLILDIALPTRTEQLRVDRHTSQPRSDTESSSSADTRYDIHLVGGAVSSCSVGYSAYGRLKDGDVVEVRSTQLFKDCIRIARGSELIEVSKYWKLFALICGGLLIASAVGWIKSGDDGDGDGISIRIG